MNKLEKWENMIADEYVHAEKIQLKENTDFKVQIALEKYKN